MVKNLPAMRETWLWSLGGEDLLEKGMATHSSILAWRISWTGEPGGLQSIRSQSIGHDRVTNTHTPPCKIPHWYIRDPSYQVSGERTMATQGS